MKITFWGADAVGKTNLLNLITKTKPFNEAYRPTIGSEIYQINTCLLWEGGGARSLPIEFLSTGTSALFLCFDPKKRASFEKLQKDLSDYEELKNLARKECKFILVETKSDSVADKVVSADEITQFKAQYDLTDHILTSAKTGEGIDEIKKIIKKITQSSAKLIVTQSGNDADELINPSNGLFSLSFLFNASIVLAAFGGVGLIIAAYVVASATYALAGVSLLATAGFFKYIEQKSSESDNPNLAYNA